MPKKMETFTVKITKIHFSKWKRKTIKFLSIVIAIPFMIYALYDILLGQIPVELKVVFFPFDYLLYLIPINGVILFLLIYFSNKSYRTYMQVNENGIFLQNDKDAEQYSWDKIIEIRTSYKDLQIESISGIFWIKFKYRYEKLNVELLIQKYNKDYNFKFESDKSVP